MTDTNWIITKVSDLQAFDIILFSSSVWVIQRIENQPNMKIIHVTRVDDGKTEFMEIP